MRNRTLQREGFVVARAVLTPAQIFAAETGFAARSSDAAGTRNLLRQPWCRALVDALRSHAAIELLLPRNAVAAQCTLFEKSRQRKWLLLHASSKATLPNRRRVLHFLFAPSSPRYGLEWNDAV
jgi:hypothetical protein